MWPVDPTTGWVAIDREGRGDVGVTVAFGVVHESAETLLPLVGLRAEALAADVRGDPVVRLFVAHVGGEFVAQHFWSGDGGPDPHRLVVAGAGRRRPSGLNATLSRASVWPASGHRWVGRYRHSTTAPSWRRSHYACPDLLRSIALAPSWSVLLALSSPWGQNSRPMHPLDHFISTRMRLRSGLAAPRTCPNGERAVRSRKSMTSSVMISPGNRLGIPGG